MSIYQTLYYKKRKQEDPEFAEKMKPQKERTGRETHKNRKQKIQSHWIDCGCCCVK